MLNTLCNKFLNILKPSFCQSLRCVLGLVAKATSLRHVFPPAIALRRTGILTKTWKFKIFINFSHSVLNKILILLITSLLFANCKGKKTSYFEEKNGFLSVEAEDFHIQELDEVRKWYRVDKKNIPQVTPDIDEPHFSSASGKAYLEILPDTRTNHDEKLIRGENFSNIPGKLGVLHYRVKINNPGKYYVWVRTYATGSEDNGIHVGLDGEWVASGQRMQWCEGRNEWTWASKQRTKEEHCGIEKQIYLQIDEPGMHTISFSMREDGFEFDKWIIEQKYHKPVGSGSLTP